MKLLVKAADLKNAMNVAALATAEGADSKQSHALFTVADKQISVQATDENRLAYTKFQADESGGDASFTADPKAMLALLGSADVDLIALDYDEDTQTLNVYASEDPEAHVSFPSHKSADMLTSDEQVGAAAEIATVNAKMLAAGIKFGMGFASTDDKNQKYASIYVKEGVITAANGSSKVGLFKAEEFAKIYSLTIRRPIVSSLLGFIDKTGPESVTIKQSDKFVLVQTPNGSSGFGFRKSLIEMPKMPASVDVPEADGIKVNREAMLKKISRLSIAMSGDKSNLDMAAEGGTLTIKTVSDRRSVERMPCERIAGETPMSFAVDCPLFKSILGQFVEETVDLYVLKNRAVTYSVGDMEFGPLENLVKKPFVAVGVMSLPRNIAGTEAA